MEFALALFLGLVPVFLFLATLIFLDSFKLVGLRSIILAIVAGFGVAFLSFLINSWLLAHTNMGGSTYSRYIAPIIEESMKAAYLIFLIASKRVGFQVDAAIYGFAIGAGFATIENIYFFNALEHTNLVLWLVRGLGTAMMHGGTTAVLAIIVQGIAERRAHGAFGTYLPGLVVAIVIHSFFNHFFLPPMLSTIVLLCVLPSIMIVIFRQSEGATRHWLGVGLDSDVEMMRALTDGTFSNSHIGQYLGLLREKFSGEIIVDMLCLIRIRTELSIKAKVMLMMKEAGYKPEADPEVQEKFEELKFLEQSIGKTGKLAMAPVFHTSSRDLWQLQMLGGS